MSKAYFIFILVVVAGMIAYWAKYPADSTVTVYLASQNDSGETGTVIVNDDATGKAHVSISLRGYPNETPQPMHFHTGSCKKIGAVKHALNSAVNGKSETILTVSTVDLMKQLPLAVNVHKSVAESGVYVACGDVEK